MLAKICFCKKPNVSKHEFEAYSNMNSNCPRFFQQITFELSLTYTFKVAKIRLSKLNLYLNKIPSSPFSNCISDDFPKKSFYSSKFKISQISETKANSFPKTSTLVSSLYLCDWSGI